MYKILVFHNKNMLKPIGGPSGYLYCLNSGLKRIDNKEVSIDFLEQEETFKELRKMSKTTNNFWLKKLVAVYRRFKHIKRVLSIIYSSGEGTIDFSKYDVIHFHATSDLYKVRRTLEKYDGKIILTSHSPQPLSQELYDGSSHMEKLILGRIYEKLLEMDMFAFHRADYITWPCETADEPYEHEWPEYIEIKKRKKHNYKYLLTGTVDISVKKSRKEIRKKYNIPENAFVISFVGRHNTIKGYDSFKLVCEKILRNYENVYILVVGKIGPLYPPNHKRWIEVGWSEDPHSFINASDVFVLPNKETYFDLVLLEVLSIGTPAIISYTGGNKYFENGDYDGIQLFRDNEECEKYIKYFMNKNSTELNDLREHNKKLYKEKFTTERFASSYIDMLNTIF